MKISINWLKRHLIFDDIDHVIKTLNRIGIETILKDSFLEITIPTNRNDLKSVRGLAKELNLFIGGLKIDKLKIHNNPIDFKINNQTPLELAFMGIKNINIKPEIKSLMEENSIPVHLIGLSGFILADEGIAMHFYENQDLTFRNSNGEKYLNIITDNEFISVDKNDKILCLLGVKGISVEKDSKNIIVEAGSINKNFIKRNITKASNHFLNNGNRFPDCINGLIRLQTIVDGDFSSIKITNNNLELDNSDFSLNYEEIKEINQREFSVPFSFIYDLTGLDIPANEIINKLNSINFESSFERDENVFYLKVKIPPHRFDIENNSDICGEIIRLFPDFYLNISKVSYPIKKYEFSLDKVIEVLISEGFVEIITNPLVLKKTNLPLLESSYFLRESLLDSFEESFDKQKFNNLKSYKYFEIGKVFNSEKKEILYLGLFFQGKTTQNWNIPSVNLDFFYGKYILSKLPYKSKIINFNNNFIEVELLPEENLYINLNEYFDLSFYYHDYSWKDLNIDTNCHIIDIYKGSMTIRIYQPKEKIEFYQNKIKTNCPLIEFR